ncbi:hypothetical protein AAG906_021746 [Vitis piasezkii]
MGLMKVLSNMYDKPFANNKTTRATINNFVGSVKLKFNDIKDQILTEEVHRIDLGEVSTLSSTLNIKSREIMENHVFGNYKNVNLTYGKPLYIVGVGDIRLKISNGFWKAMIKKKTNLKVKCLKSDNGEEYLDNDFKQYCAKNGIKMKKTIIRKPQ